ncbi:MAG: DUF3883 domain-containing protein [Pirellulaceae bacterium]|nr:DUF3883 domain-containing protein [Pirellulaceae bacterium]
MESYVASQRSHDIKRGIVHYADAPVFYEDFDDVWRSADSPRMRYAQRIDVERWSSIVPHGVPWISELKVPPNEIQRAFFKIKKRHFEQISHMLRLASPNGKSAAGKKSLTTAAEQRAAADASDVAYSKGQGFQADGRLREAIEDYSMRAAKAHFESLGYQVDDVSMNRPYDLHCTKGSELLYVEVKGTQTNGAAIILTTGEVKFARKNSTQMALFLLHSISISKDGQTPSKGEQVVLSPWQIDDAGLAALSFKYQIR